MHNRNKRINNKQNYSYLNTKLEEIKQMCRVDNSYQLALIEIENLINMYPYDQRLTFQKAKIYQGLGDIETAKEILRGLFNDNYDNKNAAVYELAKIEVGQNNLNIAETYCQYLIKANYRIDFVELLLGDIELKKCNYSKAKEHYERCNNIDLKNKKIAGLAIRTGRFDKAAKAASRSEYKKGTKDYRNDVSIALSECNYVKVKNGLSELVKDLYGNYDEPGLYFIIKTYCQIGEVERAHNLYEQFKEQSQTFSLNEMIQATIDHYEENYDSEKVHLLNVVNKQDINAFYRSRCCTSLAILEKKEKNYEIERYYLDLAIKLDEKNPSPKLEYLYLYLKNNNYDEAEKIVNKLILNDNSFIRNRALQAKCIICKEKNKPYTPRNYFEEQIFNYDQEKAVDHINKHSKEYRFVEKSMFDEDIYVPILIDKIKDKLTPDNISDFDVCDIYRIPYENVGIAGDEVSNTIEVVTLSDTKDIITMYPIKEAKKVLEKPKEKRLSQIEKFNMRYANR